MLAASLSRANSRTPRRLGAVWAQPNRDLMHGTASLLRRERQKPQMRIQLRTEEKECLSERRFLRAAETDELAAYTRLGRRRWPLRPGDRGANQHKVRVPSSYRNLSAESHDHQFYRHFASPTLRLSRAWKRKRSVRCKASAAAGC